MLYNAMEQWTSFWMSPAIIAAVIAVLFFLGFWDKIQVTEEADDDAESL